MLATTAALRTALTLLLTTPLTTAIYSLPNPYLPNGAVNPFYPCPASKPATCPYRCYTLSSSNLTAEPPSLISTCYSAQGAADVIETGQIICVKCVAPLSKEVPTSPSDPETCMPVSTYFSATTADSPPPARCGAFRRRLSECKWDCGAAQVPFSVCSKTDTTSMYSLCELCTPQCSSPRVVFEPKVGLPNGFALGNGSCGATVAETVACPWRCKDAGNPYYYCSLVDRTATFTACESCAL